MTAVDVDALDAARAAAALWMRTHLFWGLDPSKAPEAADQMFALPEFAALVAEVRRGRALREAVEELATEWEKASDHHQAPIREAAGELRAAAAVAGAS